MAAPFNEVAQLDYCLGWCARDDHRFNAVGLVADGLIFASWHNLVVNGVAVICERFACLLLNAAVRIWLQFGQLLGKSSKPNWVVGYLHGLTCLVILG